VSGGEESSKSDRSDKKKKKKRKKNKNKKSSTRGDTSSVSGDEHLPMIGAR
jgi:hypothetical protein